MRFKSSQYIDTLPRFCNKDEYRQVDLISHGRTINIFIHADYCLAGSYIRYRINKEAPWSKSFRVSSNFSLPLEEKTLKKLGYRYLPNDDNIQFIKKQKCTSNNKGVIGCR